jgi:hypothetical protein
MACSAVDHVRTMIDLIYTRESNDAIKVVAECERGLGRI